MRLIVFMLLLSFSVKAQGPIDGYNKGKGNLELGFGYSIDKGDQYYAGKTLINLPRTIKAYSLFTIYGITDKLDVQLNVPFVAIGSEKDLQDGSIYLKYNAIKKDNKLGNFNLLGAIGYYSPLTKYQTEGGNAIGQLNQSLDGRLILQQNFNSGLFVSMQGGYFLKTNPTPNAYSGSLKIGFASGKIYADAWVEYQSAIGGTDYRGTGELAPTNEKGNFRGLGFSYTKIGGTVFYPVNNFLGVYLGGAYTLNGRNIVKGTRISAGAVFKLLKNNKF